MRDDFSKKTRSALALQANYRCSFTSCDMATSGPSDESPVSVVYIGMAAHIHAASPGGARYRSDMTSEERSDISNGVWMCRNHGTLIDEDEVTYTASAIREMKRSHLERIAGELSGRVSAAPNCDLISIGPNLIVIGELSSIEADCWALQISHFVIGDLATLIELSEFFHDMNECDRYVIVNSIGDGRQLVMPPTFERSADGIRIACVVERAFPRISVENLPYDLALNESNDIFAENGNIAMIGGADALPQKIKTCLSMQYGEAHFDPSLGSHLTKYFELFRDSIWFANLLKLEVIRHAAIPCRDVALQDRYTPLMCVKRVKSVDVVGPGTSENWVVLRFALEVEGGGEWTKQIPIFIPAVSVRPKSS